MKKALIAIFCLLVFVGQTHAQTCKQVLRQHNVTENVNFKSIAFTTAQFMGEFRVTYNMQHFYDLECVFDDIGYEYQVDLKDTPIKVEIVHLTTGEVTLIDIVDGVNLHLDDEFNQMSGVRMRFNTSQKLGLELTLAAVDGEYHYHLGQNVIYDIVPQL